MPSNSHLINSNKFSHGENILKLSLLKTQFLKIAPFGKQKSLTSEILESSSNLSLDIVTII